jgi:hypothetical protein
MIIKSGMMSQMQVKRRIYFLLFKLQKKLSMNHSKQLKLVEAQLQLLSLVLFLFLLLQLVVPFGIRRDKVQAIRKVVKLMTENFTRAKSPQLMLTRKLKKSLLLMLMYENKKKLNFKIN